ncbi:MAG: lipopolysaccharide biosynthesis protein [Chitinophagaceae bacterium]|nr:MAG: lipopolysaccharide biosynthesis protein [Chitinophagaceae bacterium]
MSSIRKQSLISSVIVYAGFALGFLNIYLFTREGGFTREQYGLISSFIAFASVLLAFSGFGVQAYIGKFFPYYNAHLQTRDNDQAAWALMAPLAGFGIIWALSPLLKGFFTRIFNNSPELVTYYDWLFPFALGYTFFVILEAFGWMLGRSILTNFYKELFHRFLILVLIACIYLGLIKQFHQFVHLFAFSYIFITLLLGWTLFRRGQLNLTFRQSKVTRRYRHKILTLAAFTWSSSIIFNLAGVFDTIVIAAVLPDGMAQVGVFTLGQTLSGLIQAPQRAVVSAAVAPLSAAWREKRLDTIQRIYQRSSINQLIFATGMFGLVWLNYVDAIDTFHLQEAYKASAWVFFLMGIKVIIDMGTGVSSQIIATSTYWRFEFKTGLLLLALSLGLNFFLTRRLGIIGPAISNIVAYLVYNGIRYYFLWKKFRMQPFTLQSLLTLLLAASAYVGAYFPCADKSGLLWLVVRSAIFCAVFFPGVLLLKLSPDIAPVWATVRKRLGLGQ